MLLHQVGVAIISVVTPGWCCNDFLVRQVCGPKNHVVTPSWCCNNLCRYTRLVLQWFFCYAKLALRKMMLLHQAGVATYFCSYMRLVLQKVFKKFVFVLQWCFTVATKDRTDWGLKKLYIQSKFHIQFFSGSPIFQNLFV